MSDEIWSKQFYKALEAVGNLTEQERLKLGNMLIALSGVKEKHSNVGSTSRCTPNLPDRNAEPLPLRQLGKM